MGSSLGHRGHTVIRRYIHVADSTLIAAADTVAGRISLLMTSDLAVDASP